MMLRLVVASRVIFALIFLVMGLNGFFRFLPMPPPSEAGMAFFGALMQTGYFFPFLKIVEIVCGFFLLFNCFAPLALVVISPVVVNIVLFHMFLDPAGLPLGIFLTIVLAFLGYGYRDAFRDMLFMKVEPDA